MTSKIEWSLLANLNEGSQVDIVESLLSEANIPTLVKKRGAGAYVEIVTGMSSTGADLYVPAANFGEAQEIIDAMYMPNLVDDIDEDDQPEEYMASKRIIFAKILIVVLIVVPMLTASIFIIWDTLKTLLS